MDTSTSSSMDLSQIFKNMIEGSIQSGIQSLAQTPTGQGVVNQIVAAQTQQAAVTAAPWLLLIIGGLVLFLILKK
jgi:hypothetical protein